jgi:hypothetical protein
MTAENIKHTSSLQVSPTQVNRAEGRQVVSLLPRTLGTLEWNVLVLRRRSDVD